MSFLPKDTRLQVSIVALFAALILPALGVIIAFSHYANERTLREMSLGFMDRARDDAVASGLGELDHVDEGADRQVDGVTQRSRIVR